ncbi:MAG: hypothetical protein CM15mP107_4890 [Bacteroidota bacterium]|nr:MAG: hypothetical protein CM15mP107_4890 [Bacteroidota bacterium]
MKFLQGKFETNVVYGANIGIILKLPFFEKFNNGFVYT